VEKFIKLKVHTTKSEDYFRVEAICWIQKSPAKKATLIVLNLGGDTPMNVMVDETPEEIFKLIAESVGK
jgi:hypothetical protein